jgi:hypothetical protein
VRQCLANVPTGLPIGASVIESILERYPMKNKTFVRFLATILFGFVSLNALAATATSDGILQTPGGVSYASGGVGIDSIERLTALSGNFNLKLVFAMKSGDYVSNVKVAITDTRGNMLLDTVSDGPWLLTKLPAGNYQIAASFAGATEKRSVVIAAAHLRTVDFRWASD